MKNEKKFDLSKEYGLVLEGGGAKGAYQIGVWRAIRECGIRIKGISGVSIGALNGALIAMEDYETAVSIWSNLTYSQVMDVDNKQMNQIMNLNLKEMNFRNIAKLGAKLLGDGGFDVEPLKKLIEKVIDEKKIKESPTELYISAFSLNGFVEQQIDVKEVNDGYLQDYLLASAYFPAFKNKPLHGKKYMDGGVVNNVPLDMLIKRGYEDLLVVRIYGPGFEKRITIPEYVRVTNIAPRVDLGNVLEFDGNKSVRNMKIGYYDGMRCFLGLLGKIYYIDAKYSEEKCMYLMLTCHKAVKMALQEYFNLPYNKMNIYNRNMLERVLPRLAEELKLDKEWDYQELYLSLLELCAKNLRIQKYYIYTEEILLKEINDKYENYKQREQEQKKRIPFFIEIIIKMVTIPI